MALTTPALGASAIWRAKPMLNLMMETVLRSSDVDDRVPDEKGVARAGTG